LIPMASSLCFGLMVSTVLVLVLVPVFYSLYGRATGLDLEAHAETGFPESTASEPAEREPALTSRG
ncbi:MAG: hypothetical protein ACE5KM_09040, partial [Planctomycetaceae bacterium]